MLHVVLYGGAVIFLIPLVWMLLTALKTLQENYAYPPILLPKVAQWQNFKVAWTNYNFTLYTYHTLFITVDLDGRRAGHLVRCAPMASPA